MRKLAVVLAGALLVPSSALAATSTTVGSSLSTAGNANLPACAGGIDCVAFTVNNGTPVAVAPYDGVVTLWRVRAGSSTSPVKLRVLRPGANGSYTAISTSGTQMTTGGASPDEYPSNILVDKGDVLAIDNDSSALLYAPIIGAFSVSYWQAQATGQPAFADGMSGTPPQTYGAHEVAMNATIVEAQADLELTLADSPDPVGVGQNLTYTVAVKNSGPQPAKSVNVADTLPEGVTFKSATASTGTCNAASPVSCDLGTVASGKTETVTIVATPTAAGTIANAASATTATVDPNTANNAATTSTTVTTEPQEVPGSGPKVSYVTFAPATFRLGSFLPKAARAVAAAKKRPSVGTTVTFALSDADSAVFRFERLRRGKKPKAFGTLTRPTGNGLQFGNTNVSAAKFRFSGRLSAKKKLVPGRYRVTVTAKSGKTKSKPVRKTITVLKP